MPPQAPPGKGGRGSVLLGILSIIFGLVIAGAAFLPWLFQTGTGFLNYFYDATGWANMIHPSPGNFIYSKIMGGIFFSGFWALLAGFFILVGGAIMLFRKRLGGAFVLVFGVVGTAIAAVNVVMVYTKLNVQGFGTGINPGIGLWVFLGVSAISVVIGLVAVATGGS